jgi:voltage-gated potassium channel
MLNNTFLRFVFLFFYLPRVHPDRRHRVERVITVVRRLRWAGLLVVLGLAIGTVGYVLIEDYPWFDAYYMSVITVATVGFGEIHPLGFWGRLFTSFLILFNLGLFTYSISTITGIFAEGGFTKILREFTMQQTIQELRNHTIVCGFGRHGLEVTEELSKQNKAFVIIENDPAKVEIIRESKLLVVEGDSTEDEVLEEAGIKRAASLVITLPSDADNLYITLSARQMNPVMRIICRAHTAADEAKLRRAGADHTVVPERIGGFYMATLTDKPDLVEFFTLLSNMGPANVVFEEIELKKLNPRFKGKTIESCGLFEKARVSLIALRHPDGQYELNPPLSTMLLPEHHIVILGNMEQVADFMEQAI